MRWQGPFTVIRQLTDCLYLIDVDGVEKTHHINLLKMYRPATVEQPPIATNAPIMSKDEIEINLALCIESAEDNIKDKNDPTIPCKQTQSWEDCVIWENLLVERKEEFKKKFI